MRTALPPAVLCLLLTASSVVAQTISNFTVAKVAGKDPGTYQVTLKTTALQEADYLVEDSADLATWNRVSSVLHTPGAALTWGLTQSQPGYGLPMYVQGTQNWDTRRFYRVRSLVAAGSSPAGTGPVQPTGRLTQPVAGGKYVLVTQSGWTLDIDGTTLTIFAPGGSFSTTRYYQLWGSVSTGSATASVKHETLGGTRVKDVPPNGTATVVRRTLLLPGDVIVTAEISAVTGSVGRINHLSIYDGDQSHRLNLQNNTVEMSVLLPRAGEAAEPDGETGRIWDTDNGLYFENLYTQLSAWTGQPLAEASVPIARTYATQPNRVDDFYP